MQCELKTFGRGKDATVHKRVGKMTLKAAGLDDSEFLAMFSRIVMRPELFQILTWLGDALIDGKLTDDERRSLSLMIGRVEKEKELSNGVEPITRGGGGT